MTTRATRLRRMLDELRQRRTPVRGAQLAERLGVSLRTVYRDIDALRAQGAVIAGGRYDGMLTRLGAPKAIPAVGFSAWVERLTICGGAA